MSSTTEVDHQATSEIALEVEELEEMIAPRITGNHNEVLVSDEVELSAEELEEMIAPEVVDKLAANHNETLAAETETVEVEVGEMKEVIAPRLSANHHATLASDEVEQDGG